jgi:hypothetical protein
MVEPEREDKAEQAAGNEENKQEPAQLLKLQRKELLAQLVAPSNMLGLLSLYLIFVGAVVAFGVFAFYTGHKITQEIIFVICIILFLTLPIGALWYLRPIFTTKIELRKWLNRINQSSVSKALARLGNNRLFRLFTLAMYAVMIANAVDSFPKHPRASLAIVIIYMALAFGNSITWASEVVESKIYKTISRVLDLIENTRDMADYARGIAESSVKFIEGTEGSHSEAHKATAAALSAINNALQLVATTNRPVQADDPSKELSGKARVGDEETTEG